MLPSEMPIFQSYQKKTLDFTFFFFKWFGSQTKRISPKQEPTCGFHHTPNLECATSTAPRHAYAELCPDSPTLAGGLLTAPLAGSMNGQFQQVFNETDRSQ